MREFLGIFLIIYGLLVGVISAYSIGYENKFAEKDLNELEQALDLLGKRTLEEKKQALIKSAKISLGFYLIYTVLAFIYFNSNLLGFLLTAFLFIVEIIDYAYSKGRINKAENLKGSIWPSSKSQTVSVIHIIIIGVQIGLII